jgi:hypothetical protein
MVHVRIDVNATGRMYGSHSGQTGSGMPNGSPFFEGVRFQRGFGYRRQNGRGLIGNVFTRAWRYLIPLFKKAAPALKELAKEGVQTLAKEGAAAGSKILDDVSKGRSVDDAVKTQATEALRTLAHKAGRRLQQTGGAKKRKKRRSLSHLHVVGRSVLESAATKRNRGKNFSPY